MYMHIMYASMKIHNQSCIANIRLPIIIILLCACNFLFKAKICVASCDYIHKFESVHNIPYNKHLKLVRMKITALTFVLVTCGSMLSISKRKNSTTEAMYVMLHMQY